jgi:hypothetical protein
MRSRLQLCIRGGPPSTKFESGAVTRIDGWATAMQYLGVVNDHLA